MVGMLVKKVPSFNPRTRESATSSVQVIAAIDGVSIHALVRVRPGLSHPTPGNRSFNPRTRESATRHS